MTDLQPPIEQPLGRKVCSLAGYGDCFVQFAVRGYPRKLRKQWEVARDADDGGAVWAIVMRYVDSWSLRDITGQPLALPAAAARSLATLDDVEDAIVVWMIGAFMEVWLLDLPAARAPQEK